MSLAFSRKLSGLGLQRFFYLELTATAVDMASFLALLGI